MGLKTIIDNTKQVLSGIKYNFKDSFHYLEYKYFPTNELKGDLFNSAILTAASVLMYFGANSYPLGLNDGDTLEPLMKNLVLATKTFGLLGVVVCPTQYIFSLLKYNSKKS